jgi:molybdate transport system substrate-binding protein
MTTTAPISIYAAGSLRYVMPVLVSAFSQIAGVQIEVRHGPAGLLRERIEAGDRPDLFLSANLAHPARLTHLGLALPAVVFARNIMSALARREVGLTTQNFIDKLASPDVQIGTSTPLKDPSGDYAWAIFQRIDQVRPGAFTILGGKAQKLVGGSEPTAASAGYGPVGDALTSGQVDVFLGYRTGMAKLAAELDGVDLIDIPAGVHVTPEYGMAALKGCRPEALSFALFILSTDGQDLLTQSGFQPVSLPHIL